MVADLVAVSLHMQTDAPQERSHLPTTLVKETLAVPDTGSYKYASDVGQESIAALTELCRSSGIPFSVSSSYRSTSTTFHGTRNAIDVVGSQDQMTKLAAYLYQFYPYLLELEHTNPDGTGFWVDNGQRKDASFFGAKDYEAHRDHVHLAATNSGLKAAADWAAKQRQAGKPIGYTGTDAKASTGIPKTVGGAGCITVIVAVLAPLTLIIELLTH